MRPKELGNHEIEVYKDENTDARDPYSVIIDGEDVIALSEDGKGFDQFAGSLPPKGKVAKENLGERIRWDETPEGVKEAIIDRLEVSPEVTSKPDTGWMQGEGEPPYEIDIVWEGGSGTDRKVKAWGWDEQTLMVKYMNGEIIEYPLGNVEEVK